MTQSKSSGSANPTDIVSLDFAEYLAKRKDHLEARFEDGAPNYAFALDKVLQKKLSSMAPVRKMAQTVVSFAVPLQKQIQQMHSIAVGPRQLPKLYKITEDCARLLGIGIPQVYVCPDPEINACTIATDDIAPIILLSSGIVERLEPEELHFVIGHECGHIHNLHGTYNTAVEMMSNTIVEAALKGLSIMGVANLLGTIKQVIHGGILLAFNNWSRCAEITCDRAGMICCGDLDAAQSTLTKLVIGDLAHLGEFNTQEFIQQSRNANSTPLRMLELMNTHPLIPKRLEALECFAECETFYQWKPKLSPPDKLRSQAETDRRCQQIVTVINNKNRN